MTTSKSSDTWDTRNWLLGFVLGNFAGLLLLCGGLPFSRRFIESAFPYSAFGYYVGDFVVFLSLILGAFVFPAILTSFSKRYYALWGVLPIFLLMFWLVGGCVASHRLPILRDPPWLLLISMALCWGVASFPIALYRLLRQRCKQIVIPLPDPVPAAQKFRGIKSQMCALILLTLFLLLGILGWYNRDHPKHFQLVMQTHWFSTKEAIVPLVKHNNGLYVNAWLNDQKVVCQVDTGSESVAWSRGLHLEGQATSVRGQTCDLLGACVATQSVVLPRLKIGNYEVTNIPTEMSDAGSGPFAPALEDNVQEPLLGNTAFVQTVLTVDYKNARMIIHPPQYDFSHQCRKPGDRVLDMGWTAHYPQTSWQWHFYGMPAIEASLGHAPFWCTLDTGAGGREVCLTKTLVDRNPFIKQKRRDISVLNATSSSAQVERLRELNLKFPCVAPHHAAPISLKVDGLVTPTLDSDESGGSGVIGLPLMQRYRITIDYGRGRVLLEPYASAASSKSGRQKQEKQQPVAKLPLL